jgi:hypothetical protein
MVVSALSRTLAVAQDVSFAALCIESFGGFSRVKAATIKLVCSEEFIPHKIRWDFSPHYKPIAIRQYKDNRSP